MSSRYHGQPMQVQVPLIELRHLDHQLAWFERTTADIWPQPPAAATVFIGEGPADCRQLREMATRRGQIAGVRSLSAGSTSSKICEMRQLDAGMYRNPRSQWIWEAIDRTEGGL
jgi:hypothetical protein